MKGKRRFGLLQTVLLIADLALLVWISVSFVQARKQTDPYRTDPEFTVSWEDPFETEPFQAQPADEPAQTQPIAEPTQPAAEPTQPAAEPTQSTAESTQPAQRNGDRPLRSDFDWFTGTGTPAGARRLTDLPEIVGRWRVYIEWDPDRTNGRHEIDLLNAGIDVGQYGVLYTMDWYQGIEDNGTVRDEESMEDSVMMGEWSDGTLTAEGASLFRLTDFYSLNGGDYAVGTVESYDGVPGRIAMMK